jgi:hypothetical protein
VVEICRVDVFAYQLLCVRRVLRQDDFEQAAVVAHGSSLGITTSLVKKTWTDPAVPRLKVPCSP